MVKLAPISPRQSPKVYTPLSRASKPSPKPRRLPDLPQFYYHANFCEMLDFVGDKNSDCLDDNHKGFIAQFYALPLPAQLLYVRLAGRKGHVFNAGKFDYSEILDVADQLSTLRAAGFCVPITQDNYKAFLAALTKPELLAFMDGEIAVEHFRKSWNKPLLIDVVLTHIPFNKAIIDPLFIAQGRTAALGFILYLYFGKIEDSLQNFTLRDLGLVKMPDLKADYSARFDTLSEAKGAYFYARALHEFKHGEDNIIDAKQASINTWPIPECPISAAGRDKLLQKLGGRAERAGDIAAALTLYDESDNALCNERFIRLRYSRNDGDDRTWVKTRLEELIDNPSCDDEHHFASDFYARKFDGKRTSAVTDILRAGKLLEIDEAYRNQPERAAQSSYADKGYQAYRAENHVWRGLFGLLFWDELFDPDNASLHNGFERLPRGLTTGQFYPSFENRIEAKLNKLTRGEDIFLDLVKTTGRYHGQANGVFRWSGATLDMIKAFLSAAPRKGLATILRAMAQDYPNMKDGYPDLMLIKDGRVSFTEVKAAGDVIRRNQLARIGQLNAAGFDTDITRIDWVIDPDQIYVVVDVETTGGRPGLHRLTEIGAVKMQGGKVIDEWSSLLNPQRSIPRNITQLTGISQDMVADAPLFHEIADSFSAFMGEAIFAAHNVNFDYGFISHEFKRMGRAFRHPKICTCASMRRLYPGHRSYSLKNLCRDFGIDLTSHHRALCDAKAAAHLLNLVNEKRTDQ